MITYIDLCGKHNTIMHFSDVAVFRSFFYIYISVVSQSPVIKELYSFKVRESVIKIKCVHVTICDVRLIMTNSRLILSFCYLPAV